MLTEDQSDMLTQVINTGVVRAGSVLSDLVGQQVSMKVPLVGVSDFTNLHDCLEIEDETHLVSVCQQFHGAMEGYALLLISVQNANVLTRRLCGDELDPALIEAERSETLEEIGNILTNNVLGTISNTVGHRFEFQVPVYREGTLPEIIALSSCDANCSVGDSHTLYARANFDINDERISGSILILLTSGAFDRLVELVGSQRVKAE